MTPITTTESLADLVTVTVSPRERQYSLIPSLLSLFATVPPDVRVIVAQGDIPADLRLSLAELQKLRAFELIETAYPLFPQEARNRCVARCTTEFVVIADNDMEYEEGWLEAIVRNAIDNKSDIVAPLIFIGPPRASEIHHAGGIIRITPMSDGALEAKEIHRFSHTKISDVDVSSVGVFNHTVEFHCFLVRMSYFARSGLFDERMTTQEQIHYGLLARHLGAKVTFEAGAKVTYSAKTTFSPKDLEYLTFRWNDSQAIESMRAIKSAWGIYIDENRMIDRWIRGHRIRAYGTFYSEQQKAMSPADFYQHLMEPLERAALTRAVELRRGKKLRYVNPINAAKIDQTLRAFLSEKKEELAVLPKTRAVEKAA